MTDKAEVRADFKLDDHATATLEKVKGGLGHVGEKAKHVASEMGELFKSGLGNAIGTEMSGIINSIKGIGHEALQGALEPEETIRGLTGVLAMVDKTGQSFEELTTMAWKYNDALEGVGFQSGQTGDSLVAAFSQIADSSKKSADEVQSLVEHMAYAGKAVQGGVASIAGGFDAIQNGMIRAKNPVVQMISQMGILGGNAKEVAAQMQPDKMKPEKAIEIAEKAIARMSAKMKDVPLSAGQLFTVLKDLRGEMFEALGTPFLHALIPSLEKIRSYWLDNKDAMEGMAKSAGEKVGQWVVEAADLFKKGFEFLDTHADEIRTALREGWDTAKKVAEFIIAHKGAIALGVGGAIAGGGVSSAAGGIGSAAASAGTALMTLGKVIGTSSTDLVAVAAKIPAGFEKGVAAIEKFVTTNGSLTKAIVDLNEKSGGAVLGLGALAAAIGALYLAYDQFTKLQGDIEGTAQVKMASNDQLAQTAQFGNVDMMKQAIAETRENGTEISKLDEERYLTMAEQARAALDRMKALDASGVNTGGEIDVIADAYVRARDMNDQAAQEYAAGMILRSGITAEQMKASGVILGESMQDFEKNFVGHVDSLTKSMLEHFKSTTTKTGVKVAVTNNYNGGQKMVIEQNFRDTDPDRILLAFKNDLTKRAESRVHSRVGTPFGF